MPVREPYRTRDGTELCFRKYPSAGSIHLILIHGSSSHSAYWHVFAKHTAQDGAANVYAVDLRGHGPNPKRRGDIDYIDQLEDDLADLIGHIKRISPDSEKIVIGGHSSGGGLALRFSGGRYGGMIDGLMLLAPYLAHNAPMVRKNAGGWVSPNIPGIIGLSIIDGFGIHFLSGSKVLRFNLPEQYRTGDETLEYSFRLMRGMHPANYQTSLTKTRVSTLIIIGSSDEALCAEEFARGILPYKPDAAIQVVDGATHLGIVMNAQATDNASKWLKNIGA